jgi:hypothetical protein
LAERTVYFLCWGDNSDGCRTKKLMLSELKDSPVAGSVTVAAMA